MNLKHVYQSNLNNNKKYFLTLINKYKSNDLLSLNINIFSGRQILEEILLECKSNKLSNKINNEFLTKKIDILIRTNCLVDEVQRRNLNYIKEKIFGKNSELVYSLSSEIKKSFCSKKYFDKLIDNLKISLEDEENDKSKDIKIILDNIFIELFNKGYSIKQVSEKINNLFATASYDKNDEYNEPKTLFPTYFINDISDPLKLTEYINNLSFKDRINYIKRFYTIKTETYYLIIPINGIKLTNNLVKCNKDICLYNPKFIDPFSIKNEKLKFREDEFNINYENCSNACVKINAFNYGSAYKNGMKKIDNYVNILKLLSQDNNLNVIENYKVLLDEKKRVTAFASSSYSNDFSKREFERNIHPLNEEDIFNDKEVKKLNKKVENIIRIDEENPSNTQIILLNSIKKYSEGLENKNTQEAILKFWSSIESLFDNNFKIINQNGKFETIQEVLSAYMTYSSRYLPLHELYNDLAIATNLHFSNPKHRNINSILDIPESLLKKIHLFEQSTDSFSLYPLIKYNKEIQEHLDDYYYLPKVKNLDKYFNDKDYSSKMVNDRKKDYESNLVIIYRLRNQIIHNALSNDITTEFYLPLLKRMANFFLNAVLDEYINNKNLTIDEIILKIYSKSILYIKNTEKNSLLKLLF